MYIKWITLEVVEAVVDLDSKKIMIKLIDFSSFRVYQRGSSGSYEKGGETAQIYSLTVVILISQCSCNEKIANLMFINATYLRKLTPLLSVVFFKCALAVKFN
jgi:hypothetical protein